MAYQFGATSLMRLSTCDEKLKEILFEAIKHFDFTVLEGHRGEAAQNLAVQQGRSQTPWPTSKHNSMPSKAVDIAPYPIDWKNIERFKELGALIKKVAAEKKIKIRWGGDFKSFKDYPHFELVEG
jgi:peptidoglycan L-alanyl-D-glutamate endopeptidase CwlK